MVTIGALKREHFLIASLEVKGLWGRRHDERKIVFNEQVNILIGRNASGKTSLLTILYCLVTADLRRLVEIEFSSAKVELRSFSSKARRTIRAKRDEESLSVKFSNGPTITVPLPNTSRDDAFFERQFARALRGEGGRQLRAMGSLVPTAWLPVNRRLPVSDPEDESAYILEWDRPVPVHSRRRRSALESVDHRLSELAEQLHRYRFRIEQTLSSRYKEFEQRVLEIVLFDEERDKFPMDIPDQDSLGEDSKNLLIRAFESAELLTIPMRKRIDQHFEVLENARHNFANDKGGDTNFFVLPLIPRTGDMIEAARSLDEAREGLFEAIRRFEKLAHKFLVDKIVRVQADGSLHIAYVDDVERAIDPHRLSSGEKQILIFLTQALLAEKTPVVYMADEPELSLHIEWQSMLIDSLLRLGGEIQIIVATHSPDIVSDFKSSVITLDDMIV